MTITVRSNETPQADPKETHEENLEQTKSAPGAKASEQNESTESDTEESDDKESKDDSEDKDSDEELESKDEEGEKPRKKNGFQRRVDKLNSRVSEREREVEYWKAQALKGASDSKADKVESKPVSSEGKPNPDSFDTHAEYVEALTDWKIEQKDRVRAQEQEKSNLKTEYEKRVKSHSERVKSFSEKHEDFSERMESVDDVHVSAAVQELILSSEDGPALMYELAKNRAEFERINALSPLAAAREMGKLEAKFSSDSSPEKKKDSKKITSAPKPLDPVGKGGSKVSKDINDPDLSQHEYERLRREQIKRSSR